MTTNYAIVICWLAISFAVVIAGPGEFKVGFLFGMVSGIAWIMLWMEALKRKVKHSEDNHDD